MYKGLGDHLKELPFAITVHGKVVAHVVPPSEEPLAPPTPPDPPEPVDPFAHVYINSPN